MALLGSKYKRPSGEENKNPNNLKVTVLKQVSKNLLPGKFSENRFFLSCIGIGDRYSKSLLSEYEQHWPTNDITENFTIRLENAVRALQSVSHFVSQANRETVLEMTRNFQLMSWDCHRRCEFPSQTRCSQVAVLSLNSPNRVDAGRLEGQNLT